MDSLSGSSTGVLEANSFYCSDFLGTKAGKPFHFHLPKLRHLQGPSVTLPKPVHWNSIFCLLTEFHFPCLLT